jgi:hypothetical protein
LKPIAIRIGCALVFTLLALSLSTLPTVAQSDEAPTYIVTTGPDPVNIFTQPDATAPLVTTLPPASRVTLVELSTDGRWIQLIYESYLGWAERDALASADLPRDCVAVVGDSVPYGSLVVQVPGHGFPVVRTEPLASVLRTQLDLRGLIYLDVRDRSVPASYLSDEAELPYRGTEAFTDVLTDYCRLVVMTAWINELGDTSTPDPAGDYIRRLSAIAGEIHAASPQTLIVLLGFYYGDPADYVPQFAAENVTALNAAFNAACAIPPDGSEDEEPGALAQIPGVVCLETAPLFESLTEPYVVANITESMLYGILYEPLAPPATDYFSIYWRENPGATVRGDGMHLNALGKLTVINAVVDSALITRPELAAPFPIPTFAGSTGGG